MYHDARCTQLLMPYIRSDELNLWALENAILWKYKIVKDIEKLTGHFCHYVA